MGEIGPFVGDRYELIRELGRGGMGVVYLGHDRRRDMPVALKVLSRNVAASPVSLKREFRVVAPLRHRNLIELYELVAHERSCYFTMEVLEGVDPRRWVTVVGRPGAPLVASTLSRDTTAAIDVSALVNSPTADADATQPQITAPLAAAWHVDWARLRDVIGQLAEGLAFLHERGVVHRDVKPSNALVSHGTLKLLDFGLAVNWQNPPDAGLAGGQLVGTTAYLSPEYITRVEVGPPMDLYALGIVAFELVAGTPPFTGAVYEVARAHRKVEPPRVSTRNSDVPGDIDDLIAALLAKDPARRPTAAAVADRIAGTPTPTPRPRRRASRFVGRAAELRALGAVIGDAECAARFVVATGPSGIGKTALCDAAVARCPRPSTLVWRGRCDERERVPYRAFDAIVDDLAAESLGDDRLVRGIVHAGALARVFPALADALAPALTDASTPATDLRVERDRAFAALAELIDRMLRNFAGVILIDDLQWADAESLELIEVLIERIAQPLTILATWTADQGEAAAPLDALLERLGPRGRRLAIGPMPDDDIAALIGATSPRAAGIRIDAAARGAAGSPYLAELIAHDLDEPDADDGALLAALTEVGVAVAERRRVARLQPPERAIADACAVSTTAATFEQLREITGLAASQLHSALRGLDAERVVRATPATTGDPVYAFAHMRLRRAVYDAMAPTARAALHRRFATWYEAHASATRPEAEALALHWEAGGLPARAARWALAAADAAMTQLAFEPAARWYQRALDFGLSGEPAARTRIQLAESLFLAGHLADAARQFLDLAAAAPDASDRERWRLRAAEAQIKLGELDAGLALIDEIFAARGLRRQTRPVRGLARAGALAAARVVPRALVRRAPADAVLAETYRVIGSFLSTPLPIEAFEYVLRAIALAERSGDRAAHGLGMAMLSGYLAAGTLGRFGDRAVVAARRLAAESGDPYARMVAAAGAEITATVRGQWAAMRAAFDEGEQIGRSLGLERSWELSFLRGYRALGEIYAGEPETALAVIGTTADHVDDLFTRAILRSFRGRALVHVGQLDEARPLGAALERDRSTHLGLAEIYRQSFVGELALADGDWGGAAAVAAEMRRAANANLLVAMPAVVAIIDGVDATAQLGLGRPDRARRIAQRLYALGRPSVYAPTALRLWAQAERGLGHRRRADALLGRAARAADARGGRLERIAIAALAGRPVGAVPPAVRWMTGGEVG